MNDTTQTSHFNFEYWSELAKQDPERFEAERNATIERVINAAPEHLQDRIRGLQWQIELVRERSANSTDACVKLQEMMWNAVCGADGLLDAIENPGKSIEKPEKARAEVISLHSQQD